MGSYSTYVKRKQRQQLKKDLLLLLVIGTAAMFLLCGIDVILRG